VQSFDTAPIVERWRELYEVEIASEFALLKQFELWTCGDCGLQFFLPASICGSSAVYERLDRFSWYYLPQKWEHWQALADIRGFRPVLEIGCGFGDFIELARTKAGIVVDGLEQNLQAIQTARGRGIVLKASSLEEMVDSSRAKYGAMCSFHGLEHMARPGEFLRQCCELLAPGGRLILGLPSADSFLRLESNILDLPPHHMSRWPLRTIQFLPHLFPLRLLRLAVEPLAEIHVSGYVDAHCRRIARKLFPLANHPALKTRLKKFLLRTGFRKFLKGMTVYVVFERT
jgi:SAM-dependent methyltransferase